MSDEGFHEIQLNGKQLVFLFMAATVVSVVIFLCGVMVGRGVRSHQASTDPVSDVAPVATAEESVRPEPSTPPTDSPRPASGAAAPPNAPPEPAEDGSDYHKQLTGAEAETAPKVEAPPAPAPERRAAAPDDKPAAPPSVTPASAGGVTGAGYVVQVAALRDRSEADAIVKRLAGKGYQAFVVNPVPGKPPVYKVQVGRFAERGDAEKTAARLKSQEQYSPWVTR
jgi:cell division septation protein DedD